MVNVAVLRFLRKILAASEMNEHDRPYITLVWLKDWPPIDGKYPFVSIGCLRYFKNSKEQRNKLKKEGFLSFQWVRKLRLSKINRVNVVVFFVVLKYVHHPHLSPSKYVFPFVDIIFITIIYNIINAVCVNRYICSLLKCCYDIEHRLNTSTWTLLFCRRSCSFYQKLSFFREQNKIK